jgi:transcriptional regulator with XRE-family HTH domain
MRAPAKNAAHMGNRGQARRAGMHARRGRIRARAVAARLGTGLRESRLASQMTQAQLADRAGVSQAWVSLIERGRGHAASIETWSVLAASVGEQFVGFLEGIPGSDRPRDIEHLRRQSALIEIAQGGGWTALPEMAIDPSGARSRSVDVGLIRPARSEAVVTEIWDWFDDVGGGFRSLDGKVGTLRSRLATGAATPPTGGWTVRGLYIVRDTHRNRHLVRELSALFAARFRGSSTGWLAALSQPGRAMPNADGFLWSTSVGTTLRPIRLWIAR